MTETTLLGTIIIAIASLVAVTMIYLEKENPERWGKYK